MSQIKGLLIHMKDMLIDAIERILLLNKYGRYLAVVKVSQGRMIAIDGKQRIRSAGSTGRQIIGFHANGFQFGMVKKRWAIMRLKIAALFTDLIAARFTDLLRLRKFSLECSSQCNNMANSNNGVDRNQGRKLGGFTASLGRDGCTSTMIVK